VTGHTESADYPTTPGTFDRTLDPEEVRDAFVTKLSASGSTLAYSTFLGGTNDEVGLGIAVRDGAAYVTGRIFSFDSISSDYPTTPGAFDRTFNGGIVDAFVTKLNASGSALAYSTFLGGTDGDGSSGIAVREARTYVTGGTHSYDYPTTVGAFDTTLDRGSDPLVGDAFVTKLNASGSAIAYSTFLGGTDSDGSSGIAVDGTGSAYVTGFTLSYDYPTTPGAFDGTFNGSGGFSGDVFVAKLPTG
jgi:hypothetical protein